MTAQRAATTDRVAFTGEQREVFETSFTSTRSYANPFMDVEVNVRFSEGTRQWVVPAFWASGRRWTVRFAPPTTGEYSFRVECTDPANVGLNGSEEHLIVSGYLGSNPLLARGPVRASRDGRHFEHEDGAAFLWLGDTWWKNLCKRMSWRGFRELARDRRDKGFSVIQVVCGPYPDEGPFEERWENEGGKPYLTHDLSVVNPRYFRYADRRIRHLVDESLLPAIVGAWGRGDCDAMANVGIDGLKRHWRHLVARYSALPVVWVIAGEIGDEAKWGEGAWAEVTSYVRSIDPSEHPIACHTSPGKGRRGATGDVDAVDFDMVGGTHDATGATTAETLAILTSACAVSPRMPVLVGETCYEAHMQQGFQDVQRHMFWMYMLSGAAGHTYGAAGVWHASIDGDPGCAKIYDWTTWREGMAYPGSRQVGLGKKLLERYPWWRFEPHPEWVDPDCYAAGIADEVRIVYMPRRKVYDWTGPTVRGLDPDIEWHAYYVDPATGRTFDQGSLRARSPRGRVKPVDFTRDVPSPQDWILVLERVAVAGR